MIRKIVFGALLVFSLGITTIAYAKMNSNQVKANSVTDDSMYSIMEQSGYDELAQDIRDGDYNAMSDFMNNLSDDDYQKMIDLMKEYGYGSMAYRMEQIDQDDMMSIYNSRGGSVGCFR